MPHNHFHRRHAPEARGFIGDVVSAIAAPFQASPGQFKQSATTAAPAAAKTTVQQQDTMTSVVYVTVAPTFDGSVAGYSTQFAGTPISQSAAPSDTSTPDAQITTADPVQTDTPVAAADPSTTAVESSIILAPSSDAAATSSFASSNAASSPTSTFKVSSTPAKTSLFSATPTSLAQDSTANTGPTTGAKAGIAIGVLLGVGAFAALIFFFCRQRRRAAERKREEDEKYAARNDIFAANRSPSVKTTAKAPRLSLRGVTPFLPSFAERRTSRGNMLNVAHPAPMANRAPSPQSAWERPMTSDSQNRANPFGNHAEPVDAINAAGPRVIQGTGPGGEIMAGAAGAGAAVGLTRVASKLYGSKPQDFTQSNSSMGGPPSPSGTEFSFTEAQGSPSQTSGGAAIAAAGGPPNSTVHRVQLDFKPSMEDELEIQAGQLIRLLHEYDDGWALCIRLDRSEQGVVPRTCLSTRPVKPRPQQNGPRGNPPPGMRVPQQQQGRPMSPAMNMGQRSASPAGGRGPQYSPQGRPASPAMNMGQRSASPAGGRGPQYPPQGRPQSPAMNMGQRSASPAGMRGPQYPANGRSASPASRPMNHNGAPRTQSPSPRQFQERRLTPPEPSGMGMNGNTSPEGSPPRRKPVPGQAM